MVSLTVRVCDAVSSTASGRKRSVRQSTTQALHMQAHTSRFKLVCYSDSA